MPLEYEQTIGQGLEEVRVCEEKIAVLEHKKETSEANIIFWRERRERKIAQLVDRMETYARRTERRWKRLRVCIEKTEELKKEVAQVVERVRGNA